MWDLIWLNMSQDVSFSFPCHPSFINGLLGAIRSLNLRKMGESSSHRVIFQTIGWDKWILQSQFDDFTKCMECDLIEKLKVFMSSVRDIFLSSPLSSSHHHSLLHTRMIWSDWQVKISILSHQSTLFIFSSTYREF